MIIVNKCKIKFNLKNPELSSDEYTMSILGSTADNILFEIKGDHVQDIIDITIDCNLESDEVPFYENGFTYMQIFNTDAFIIVTKYCLDLNLVTEVDYPGSLFWLMHDLTHVQYDTSGPSIYVSNLSELRAIKSSMSNVYYYATKFNLDPQRLLPSLEYRKYLYDTYVDRFKITGKELLQVQKILKIKTFLKNSEY